VQDWGDYYGLEEADFLEYLATLGLRTYAGDGEDKAAFGVLIEEVARRGWRPALTASSSETSRA
jgi:hypothetical protein